MPLLQRLRIFIAIAAFVCVQWSPAQRLTGLFDAGWSTAYLDSAVVDSLYGRLHAMGMQTVVLQYAAVQPDHLFYPSTLAWTTGLPNQTGLFPKAFAAAKHYGLKVWAGLYFENTAEWWGAPDSVYLTRQATRSIELLNDLEAKYGGTAELAGYYLPQELARYYWQVDADRNRLERLFLAPVTAAVHAKGRKLMAAPFYNSTLETPAQLGSFLDSLFAHWDLDVMAMQDGIGATHVSFANLGAYLRAVKGACQRAGTEFWIDAELFDGTALASDARMSQQLDTAAALGAVQVIGYDLATVMQAPGTGMDRLSAWQAARPVATLTKPSQRPLTPYLLDHQRYDLLGRTQTNMKQTGSLDSRLP